MMLVSEGEKAKTIQASKTGRRSDDDITTETEIGGIGIARSDETRARLRAD